MDRDLCHRIRDQLHALRSDELSALDRERAEEHLAHCEACAEELAFQDYLEAPARRQPAPLPEQRKVDLLATVKQELGVVGPAVALRPRRRWLPWLALATAGAVAAAAAVLLLRPAPELATLPPVAWTPIPTMPGLTVLTGQSDAVSYQATRAGAQLTLRAATLLVDNDGERDVRLLTSHAIVTVGETVLVIDTNDDRTVIAVQAGRAGVRSVTGLFEEISVGKRTVVRATGFSQRDRASATLLRSVAREIEKAAPTAEQHPVPRAEPEDDEKAEEGEATPEMLHSGLLALLSHQVEEVPGWPWGGGETKSSPNLGGMIAVSLLETYRRKPDPATWVTLIQYGHHVRAVYGADGVDSGLPYKADIEFLAASSRAGLSDDGIDVARALFDRLRAVSPAGQDEYRRIVEGRKRIPSVVGYDVALGIRAALAVGEREYALELARAAVDDDQLRLADPDNGSQTTSVGAMLHALSLLEQPKYAGTMQSAAAALVAAQASHGAWAFNNTQATAYAVLGLWAVDSREAHEAAVMGQAWLATRQMHSGDWPEFHDGLPEPFVGRVNPLVEAEVLRALMAPQPRNPSPTIPR